MSNPCTHKTYKTEAQARVVAIRVGAARGVEYYAVACPRCGKWKISKGE